MQVQYVTMQERNTYILFISTRELKRYTIVTYVVSYGMLRIHLKEDVLLQILHKDHAVPSTVIDTLYIRT